jgi:hypothetical protein
MNEQQAEQNPETSAINLDPLKDVKAKLTQEDRENFFKAFLADKPYVNEETLFEGKLQLKFASLSIRENNAVLNQMQFDRDRDIAQNNDAYLIRVIQYRLAASLIELDKKPFAEGISEEKYPTSSKDGTTYISERLKLMENWPVYKISSITDAFNRFEKKLRALTEESFKENF